MLATINIDLDLYTLMIVLHGSIGYRTMQYNHTTVESHNVGRDHRCLWLGSDTVLLQETLLEWGRGLFVAHDSPTLLSLPVQSRLSLDGQNGHEISDCAIYHPCNTAQPLSLDPSLSSLST